MEAPALCFLSAKPIQIEKPHRSYGIWQVPDSDRYKTDSNLRQILLILCTYTLPTHEHSAPLELFLQSLAKELLCVMQQNQLFSVLQLNGFLFPGGAGKGKP